jgi:hypothetical protein
MAKQRKARRNTKPRKSSLDGRLVRLQARINGMGKDEPDRGLHMIRPGSMKSR